ncbi:MAG: hypothetical protein R3F17_14195 [Planctomycetota bacterium]
MFIQSAVDDVKQAGALGAIFAVLVILVVPALRAPHRDHRHGDPDLGDATFAPMMLTGVSLNIMSLGWSGPRHRHAGGQRDRGARIDHQTAEAGDAVLDASVRGTREVAGAITAGPPSPPSRSSRRIVFVEGIAG